MAQPLKYDFRERLTFSEGVSECASVEAVILGNLPGACKVIPAHKENDKNGTDWWVETKGGNWLSVDAKVRQEDWATKPEPFRADDLALETWSVVEKNIIGWTRNDKKRTDYILWLWTDSGRWCLVPFPMLCKVFEANWRHWQASYKTARQYTPRGGGGYHSECIFVPRRALWSEIYKHFGGAPA